jgi:hypothetical protein
MVGTSEPLQISGDRMPKTLKRREPLDRGVKDNMIRKRAINRRHPSEPAPMPKSEGAQTLESPEAPH